MKTWSRKKLNDQRIYATTWPLPLSSFWESGKQFHCELPAASKQRRPTSSGQIQESWSNIRWMQKTEIFSRFFVGHYPVRFYKANCTHRFVDWVGISLPLVNNVPKVNKQILGYYGNGHLSILKWKLNWSYFRHPNFFLQVFEKYQEDFKTRQNYNIKFWERKRTG